MKSIVSLLYFASWFLVFDADPIYAQVLTGAERLAMYNFELLQGKRVGLITNHTAVVHGQHVIDLFYRSPNVKLTTLFGPEHGIRGLADAGAAVTNGRDPQTNLPVYSLYGATKKPTAQMLKNVDVLVFDIQDVGARFYTYISTMALAMQAAAENDIPFLVLDRPNPLGGMRVSGFMLEPRFTSFVGQFAIPIQHGMTVGELAQMIHGEKLMPGLDSLQLTVVKLEGWYRTMLWEETQLPWVRTSPNIPDVETAYLYPGMCFFEGTNLSEGRGTQQPFKTVGAPWANAQQLANTLNAKRLPGVVFQPTNFVPKSIPNMATSPKLQGRKLYGVQLKVTDPLALQSVEVGIHTLAAFYAQATPTIRKTFFLRDFMGKLAGTNRLIEMLEAGKSPEQIIRSWHQELAAFQQKRMPYLLY
ncbi:MAG: DUF1343 domain-containing protein [Bacteroidetes Order II. Incertae sedis bacterium]|nr:DUF1343 domain-containing protein [Bacteroidetes Order II. bacterium]